MSDTDGSFRITNMPEGGPWSKGGEKVTRGVGCFSGRDAVVAGNVWAGYTHLHALATSEWARAILGAAASAEALA